MNKVTPEQIEAWLGTSEPFEEAIEVLTDIANGEYTIENFREDVQSYDE